MSSQRCGVASSQCDYREVVPNMWIEVHSTSRKQCAVVAISPYKRSFSSTARSAKVSHAGEIAERMPYHWFGWMGFATEKPRISKLCWWLEICESFQNNSPFSGSCMLNYQSNILCETSFQVKHIVRSFGHGNISVVKQIMSLFTHNFYILCYWSMDSCVFSFFSIVSKKGSGGTHILQLFI